MDVKEDTEEGGSSSSLSILEQMSEEAIRVAGETIDGPKMQPLALGHRRSQSEILTTPTQKGGTGFQKLKNQMQKAWKRGSNQDDSLTNFNPEVLANQKRQWYLLHSKSKSNVDFHEPDTLFDHFVIVGLHPDANLQASEPAFIKRKKWETDMISCGITDMKLLQQKGPPTPTLEPQVLFKYPPGKKLAVRLKDLASFCFPAGVKARLMDKTPSLSDLNRIVYGQEHLDKDDLAFIFSLKVADNATIYGVCLHVSEIVQRPPAILGISPPYHHSSGGLFRFLVCAPRCYCLLSKYPFFELHYEILNSIIQQERLRRITQFVNGMSLNGYTPTMDRLDDEVENDEDSLTDPSDNWMRSTIPINSALAHTAVSAGNILDDETQTSSLNILDSESPRDFFSDATDSFYDCGSSDTSDRILGIHASNSESLFSINGRPSSEIRSRNHTSELLESSESLFSPARSFSEGDNNEDLSVSLEFSDDLILAWARENKNDLLQIVCGFHALPLPKRGSKLVFQPFEHIQATQYMRPSISSLGFDEHHLDSYEDPEVDAKLTAAEEALSLSLWTIATICRVLLLKVEGHESFFHVLKINKLGIKSLQILALVAGVLLEKQVIIVCPNLGVLSAVVLSTIPMIRPFQWQSLMLPILPGKMLDFLNAPVPFITGIEQVPADLKKRTSDPVVVNVVRDQVKLPYHLPTLPRYRELAFELAPIHSKLSQEGSFARKHPVYTCNEVQAEAATQFLKVMKSYIESLFSEMNSYTITSVQSDSDRVSILLKDSFIDSFPSKDRSFIKLLIDTQMFSVLSDSRLSSLEHGDL